jgi:hypothetical protein
MRFQVHSDILECLVVELASYWCPIATAVSTQFLIMGEGVGRACCMHGDMRNVNKILVRKSEEKSSFWRPRHRWGMILKIS